MQSVRCRVEHQGVAGGEMSNQKSDDGCGCNTFLLLAILLLLLDKL